MSEADVKRLERLSKSFIHQDARKKRFVTVDEDDFKWLIGRVQESERLIEGNSGMSVKEIRSQFIYLHRDFIKLQGENEQITDLLVQIRNTFTEQDELAEGHGMDDAVACPVAVAQYALNKVERTIEDNKRLREAITQSLEKHKWNNEESARILEQALEVLE